MSQDPFQIIRPTDEAPPELRKEVLGSVKTIILMMRFSQLFLADYSHVLFENFKLLGSRDGKNKKNG